MRDSHHFWIDLWFRPILKLLERSRRAAKSWEKERPFSLHASVTVPFYLIPWLKINMDQRECVSAGCCLSLPCLWSQQVIWLAAHFITIYLSHKLQHWYIVRPYIKSMFEVSENIIPILSMFVVMLGFALSTWCRLSSQSQRKACLFSESVACSILCSDTSVTVLSPCSYSHTNDAACCSFLLYIQLNTSPRRFFCNYYANWMNFALSTHHFVAKKQWHECTELLRPHWGQWVMPHYEAVH